MSMYAGLYLIHIVSLTTWLGALVVLLVLMRGAQVNGDRTRIAALANGKVWAMLQAAAFAVLLSGIGMIVNAGWLDKSEPLWLKLMEDGGGLVALLFVVLVTLGTRKWRKALVQGDDSGYRLVLKRMSVMSLSFVLAIVSVVFIVSERLV